MGLRSSSISSLRIKDFFIKDGLLACRYYAKGDPEKKDPKLMHPFLIRAFEEYKIFLRQAGRNPNDPNILLFPKKHNLNEPMTTEGIREIFKNYFKKAGIESTDPIFRYGSHVMRNTFSNELRRQNVPIQDISEALDHANIMVTKRSYIKEEKPLEKSPVTKITY